MRVITAFLLLQSMVLGQDFNLFDWVKPAPVASVAPVLTPTIKLVKPYSPPIATLSYQQMLDLHDAMHDGDNIDRPGHWSFPGDIATHLQGHPDNRPAQRQVTYEPAETVLDVEPLRNGKYAFIVVEATDQEFFEWVNRTEIEEKGWSVVRQPRRVRLASLVVIGKRVFPVRGYVTNSILRDCVAKTITAKTKPMASGLKITMISRANCSWCDKWMQSEYPKAIAAGVQVEFQTSNTGSVPRFEVCGADGQCRLFTGFTSFEKMER